MSTMTISAPLARTRRAVPVRPHAVRPVAARPVAARSVAAPKAALRLTRRGRVTLVALLAAAGFAGSLFSGAVSLAGTSAEHAPVRYVTVAPGETLWSLAGEVAPDADRRDTVARIVELNALPSSALQAGQRVAVPTGR